MKIYIVGTGAVGGYFGSLMAKGGLNVTFVARGQQYQVIKKNGLKTESVAGDFIINPAQVIENISEIADPEVIIVTVKTYDNLLVAHELAKVITEKTSIITIQNGMNNDLLLKAALPTAHIYPGAAYVIAARTAPGVISQTGGQCRIVFGDRQNPNNQALQALAEAMQSAGVNATASDDITRDIWRKYILIIAFSSLTALKKQTIGKIMAEKESKDLYESCVREAISVARSLKINLPENIFEEIMETTQKTAPGSKSSFLLDIENGRKTEIETLIGALVHLADEQGVNVANCQQIYEELTLELNEFTTAKKSDRAV